MAPSEMASPESDDRSCKPRQSHTFVANDLAHCLAGSRTMLLEYRANRWDGFRTAAPASGKLAEYGHARAVERLTRARTQPLSDDRCPDV